MRNWYCIYTKPNQEDTVCRKLSELPGAELFNPKLKRRKYIRSRLKEVVEGLFPSYVFSRLDLFEHYHTIRYTRGVRRFVGDSSGCPYVVDESLIHVIQSKMEEGCLNLEHPRLIKGEKVVILNGPFSGLTGLFMNELKPNERVMILLNTLQYQAKVEVPAELVARI